VSQPIRVCRQLRVEVGAGAKASVIDIAGDPGILQSLMGVMERGDPSFNIVTP
jgi:alkyl sulfatase BDS1-like metallo-beta-lactamase superfamily hydrolase